MHWLYFWLFTKFRVSKVDWYFKKLWMGFSYLKATEQLQGGSLFLTTKSPVAPGTYFVDHRMIKG